MEKEIQPLNRTQMMALKWTLVILILFIVGIFLYAGIIATAWELLHSNVFYFYWSFGLAAVPSYVVSDLGNRKFFDKLKEHMPHTVLRIGIFIETIFFSALIVTVLGLVYQYLIKNYIVQVLYWSYPVDIGLAALYFLTVYRKPVTNKSIEEKPKRLKKDATAKDLIMVLSVAFVALGIISTFLNSSVGFTLIAIGGDVIVTYLVIDALLLSEDRRNWEKVRNRVNDLIQRQFAGILIDATLITGASMIVSAIPPGMTNKQEHEFHKRQHINELRRMVVDIDLLREGNAMTPINLVRGDVGSLFKHRSQNLEDLQLRYWTKFIDPAEVLLMIELSTCLRDLDSDINIARKYSRPATNPLMHAISTQALNAPFQRLRVLVNLLLAALDSGLIRQYFDNSATPVAP